MSTKFALKLKQRNKNYERIQSNPRYHIDNSDVCDSIKRTGTLGDSAAASFLAQQNKRLVNSRWYSQIKTVE